VPGKPARIDDEYIRNGVVEIFVEVEPLAGRRHVAITSLYETFESKEARRLAERLDVYYTPKHGSWLNMAEIELSVMKGQCLNRRIPDITTMQTEVAAWEKDRNNSAKNIVWQFTTPDARVKLKRLYPKL
jgi:hypothetical protein